MWTRAVVDGSTKHTRLGLGQAQSAAAAPEDARCARRMAWQAERLMRAAALLAVLCLQTTRLSNKNNTDELYYIECVLYLLYQAYTHMRFYVFHMSREHCNAQTALPYVTIG